MPEQTKEIPVFTTHGCPEDNRDDLKRAVIAAERSRKKKEPLTYVEVKALRWMICDLADLMADGEFQRNGEYFIAADDMRITSGRRTQKLQRAIARAFPAVKAHLRAAVCSKVQAACWPTGELVLATGVDAEAAYREFGNHTGGVSACMTGDRASCVRLYANNPARVTVAYYRIGSRIVARRLVWECDNGEYWLDRQYPNHHTDGTRRLRSALLAHLDGEQVWERDCHSQGDYGFQCAATGNPAPHYAEITVDTPDNGKWPYLDTFLRTHDNPEGDSVTLTNKRIEHCVYFQNTCGSLDDYRRFCRCGVQLLEGGHTCQPCRQRQQEEADARALASSRICGLLAEHFRAPNEIMRENHGTLYYHPTRNIGSSRDQSARWAIATTRSSRFLMLDGWTSRICPVDNNSVDRWRVVPADGRGLNGYSNAWREITDQSQVPEYGFLRTITDDGDTTYYRTCSEGQTLRVDGVRMLTHMDFADNGRIPFDALIGRIEVITIPNENDVADLIERHDTQEAE